LAGIGEDFEEIGLAEVDKGADVEDDLPQPAASPSCIARRMSSR
jgi:hypothetical protein